MSTDKAADAIAASLKHWREILEILKGVPDSTAVSWRHGPNIRISHKRFDGDIINNTLYIGSDECKLCATYYNPSVHWNMYRCWCCPLQIGFGRACMNKRSLWIQVSLSLAKYARAVTGIAPTQAMVDHLERLDRIAKSTSTLSPVVRWAVRAVRFSIANAIR